MCFVKVKEKIRLVPEYPALYVADLELIIVKTINYVINAMEQENQVMDFLAPDVEEKAFLIDILELMIKSFKEKNTDERPRNDSKRNIAKETGSLI